MNYLKKSAVLLKTALMIPVHSTNLLSCQKVRILLQLTSIVYCTPIPINAYIGNVAELSCDAG